MHLLPENVLVSGDESIPGLAASPTGKPHVTGDGVGTKKIAIHVPTTTDAILRCLKTFVLCCALVFYDQDEI